MAQVKGKFIKMTGNLMLKNELEKANDYLLKTVGLTHTQLDNEEWYDTSVFDNFMRICVQHSFSGDKIYETIGKRVYPTIQKTVGLPDNLKTPSQYVLFETQGFLMNHKGDDVIPRKILQNLPNKIVLQAKAPGYDSKLYKGVFLGLLELSGVKSGEVIMKPDDVFEITWK